MATRPPINYNTFNVAVICALKIESDAVEGIFDQILHPPTRFARSKNDPNTYILGQIGHCNVVLAYLPHKGKTASAAATATLRSSFPKIELVLVVGVCGGVPNTGQDNEIILGDVIISTEVHQFDFGTVHDSGFYEKSTVADSLGRATAELRAFINYLRGITGTEHLKRETVSYLSDLVGEKNPRFRAFRYPGAHADRLFPAGYLHKHYDSRACHVCAVEDEFGNESVCGRAHGFSCARLGCDRSLLLSRPRLDLVATTGVHGGRREVLDSISPDLRIYFGPIASGDQVLRSAMHRDRIAEEHRVIAFEMEAAGVWDNISTVVIKGVSDYADSHKDKDWQPYAAAVAAACMKAFLRQWTDVEPDVKVENERERSMAEIDSFFNAREGTVVRRLTGSFQNVLVAPGGNGFGSFSGGSLGVILYRFAIMVGLLTIVVSQLVIPAVQKGDEATQPPVSQGMDPGRPIFGILGKTGVGKSTFIDLLGGKNFTGHPPVICHGLESCTSELEYYEAIVDNTPIYLIDTPGFDDNRRTDDQIMTLIVEQLQHDKLLKGLIYLHDITQPRFGRLAENHIYLFEKLCGVQAFQNIMLVTTKWTKNPWLDGDESDRQQAREKELEAKYWKPMIEHGSRVAQHDNTAGSARRIVTWLLNNPTIMRLNNSPRHRLFQGADDDGKPDSKTESEGNQTVAVGETHYYYDSSTPSPHSWWWWGFRWLSIIHLLIVIILFMLPALGKFENVDGAGIGFFFFCQSCYLWALYRVLWRPYCGIVDALLVLFCDTVVALAGANDFPLAFRLSRVIGAGAMFVAAVYLWFT